MGGALAEFEKAEGPPWAGQCRTRVLLLDPKSSLVVPRDPTASGAVASQSLPPYKKSAKVLGDGSYRTRQSVKG